jgi:hypothetical protein
MTAQSHYPRMHQGDVPFRHNARSTRIARAFALSRRAKSRDIAHLQSGAVSALLKDESHPLLRLGDEIARIVDETHEKPWGILESSSRIFGLNSALAGPEARGRSELCCFYRKWTAQAIVEISCTHCRHAWTRLDRQEVLLLAHPEVSVLLSRTEAEPRPRSPRSWQRFIKNSALLARYRVTKPELQVLEHLSLPGTAISTKEFLAILTLIRDIPEHE